MRGGRSSSGRSAPFRDVHAYNNSAAITSTRKRERPAGIRKPCKRWLPAPTVPIQVARGKCNAGRNLLIKFIAREFRDTWDVGHLRGMRDYMGEENCAVEDNIFI